jgi:hypothetical protein
MMDKMARARFVYRAKRELLGAKDAATLLGVQVPNLKQTGLQPVTRISGDTIPVYLRDDVEKVRAEREERAARRAALSE